MAASSMRLVTSTCSALSSKMGLVSRHVAAVHCSAALPPSVLRSAKTAAAVKRLNRIHTSATGQSARCASLFLGDALTISRSPCHHHYAAARSLQSSRVVADYSRVEEGAPDSFDYRIFYTDKDGNKISPWHDIPLHAGDGLLNMVCEIPRETSAKMEVATDETNTPIKQDTKKGKLRFYPYNINWNYGLLPQTWEDPNHSSAEVENAAGDNDPVDVVEIGEKTAVMGEVYAVKPLAVLAMIDDGELDWKVICIRADDPKAALVNDVEDVENVFPGTLTAIRDWFRDYKIPDGKPANKFGLGNKPADKEYALKVIKETNEFWAKLVKRSAPKGELSLV